MYYGTMINEILNFFCRYVDVSTVDGPTSKLINAQIKETGALFLEVSQSLSF